MMRVLLDTNVLLDALLQRAPWHVEADAILQAATRGEVIGAVTPISLANMFYVGRRIVGTERARREVRTSLAVFEILATNRETLLQADVLPGPDFEDNIQIAAAVAAGVDAIVTRDPADFSASPVTVLTPAQLLALLAAETSPGG